MDQLVFLQEQLVSLDSSSTSHHLFAALSLLRSNCTKEDVETAIISGSVILSETTYFVITIRSLTDTQRDRHAHAHMTAQ